MSICYDQPLHDACCEAYREIATDGLGADHVDLVSALHTAIVKTVVAQGGGLELELAAHLRDASVDCSHLRELLMERGRR